MDDFRLGNIVLGLEFLNQTVGVEFEQLLAQVLDVTVQDLKKDFAVRIKQKIENQELLFISIDASYGFRGVIICRDVATETV